MNYWNRMPVLNSNMNYCDDSDIFLTKKITPLIDKNFLYKKKFIKGEIKKKELNKLDKLYRKYFTVVANSNIVNIKESLIKFNYLDADILYIKKSSKIIGSIVNFSIPLKINVRNYIFGCVSYLVLKDKYRKKGFGMFMIQEIIQKTYNNNNLAGYFINKVSRCDNSIEFKFWRINNIPRNNKNIDTTNLKYLKISAENCEEALLYLLTTIKNDYISFSPSLEYWRKWCDVFPTYLVFQKDTKIGVFSYKSYDVLYQNFTLKYCSNLICIGKQPETFNMMVHNCKKFFDVINISELGEISKEMLKNFNGIPNDFSSYINFYNLKINIEKKDFKIPIF